MVLESVFKTRFKRTLKREFPGCLVITTDPSNDRSLPDTIFLYQGFWAGLEFKASETSSVRPNQLYKVDNMNSMSFGRFVFPENEREVLNELKRAIEER
jgi:hypothetical protein